MRKLNVNPEYKRMVPRPSTADYLALEADIVEKGEAHTPIIVNRDDVILDGHTRYDICTRNGCFFSTVERNFETVLDERMFVISSNLFRRHLSDYKKIELARPLERMVAKQAEARQIEGTLASNEVKGATSEIVAKQIGVSKSTYERGKKIRDSHNLDIQGRVRRGELSISAGYNKLKPPKPKKVKADPTPRLGCICFDCPVRDDCKGGSR